MWTGTFRVDSLAARLRSGRVLPRFKKVAAKRGGWIIDPESLRG
jgi:hypothetical protein